MVMIVRKKVIALRVEQLFGLRKLVGYVDCIFLTSRLYFCSHRFYLLLTLFLTLIYFFRVTFQLSFFSLCSLTQLFFFISLWIFILYFYKVTARRKI